MRLGFVGAEWLTKPVAITYNWRPTKPLAQRPEDSITGAAQLVMPTPHSLTSVAGTELNTADYWSDFHSSWNAD